MLLKDLIEGIYFKRVDQRFLSYTIKDIVSDSRKVQGGSLFVALKGCTQNGASYIAQAIDQGAACVACEEGITSEFLNSNICFLNVNDPVDFLAQIVNRFYSDPCRSIQCVGITGTNGKTTVSFLVESILKAAEKKCGVIGTINCHFEDQQIPLRNTTPDILRLTQCLFQMKEAGVEYCAMEVSSHALDQRRVHRLPFCGGVFTNLTQDHLDYHYTMENYFLSKAKLFESLSDQGFAVINHDDPYGFKIAQKTKARVIRYGFEASCDLVASHLKMSLQGTRFVLSFQHEACEIESLLIGRHNVYNVLAAAGAAFALGIHIEQIKQGIENLTCVPGRLERLEEGQDFLVFVDYAHTEDALQNVLECLRSLAQGRILLVFGCGGNRDKTKRSKMGKVASILADFSILTDDNPRDEDPEEIVDRIVLGFENKKYLIVHDRKKAIQRAFGMAKKNDIVVIAGKGHEDYQIFRRKTIFFDDRKIAQELLK